MNEMLINGKWDIRCPQSLANLFPDRTGYYYKIDKKTAVKVCIILSQEYKIPSPNITVRFHLDGVYASYSDELRTIFMFPRNHIKSIFHEFYHHLDKMTNGKYNSEDRSSGTTSLSWQFADRLFTEFRMKKAII